MCVDGIFFTGNQREKSSNHSRRMQIYQKMFCGSVTPQSEVSGDKILRELRLMSFTPFNVNTCKWHLCFAEKPKVALLVPFRSSADTLVFLFDENVASDWPVRPYLQRIWRHLLVWPAPDIQIIHFWMGIINIFFPISLLRSCSCIHTSGTKPLFSTGLVSVTSGWQIFFFYYYFETCDFHFAASVRISGTVAVTDIKDIVLLFFPHAWSTLA